MSENAVQKPQVAIPANLQVGDIFQFGRYPQSDKQGNVFEEIDWRVLARDGDTALIVSVMGLDAKPYHEEWVSITWEDCTLRAWLNDGFYNAAFNDAERAKIELTHVVNENNPYYETKGGNDTEDKVFLLSITEAETYFGNDDDRKLKPTKYAIANGAWTNSNNGNGWWWLRSPGDSRGYAAGVRSDGDIFTLGDSVIGNDTSVRPAMRIKLGN